MTLDQCIEKADKGRPDLKIARKAVEISEEDVTIAESGFIPILLLTSTTAVMVMILLSAPTNTTTATVPIPGMWALT